MVVQSSELVPFEELFKFEDSLVLDPSVIVGRIWFMDTDTAGNLLITDLAHLFTPAGDHTASFSMDACFPTDTGLDVWTAQFAGDNRVILAELGDAVVLFDRSGECLAAKRLAAKFLSFCTAGDSVFVFRGLKGLTKSVMDVYSLGLGFGREINLALPELTRLNLNYHGVAGRDLACFDRGPWYKYHEEMDARPVYVRGRVTKALPDFFVQRDEDLRADIEFRDRSRVLNAFPTPGGLYALDKDSRMGTFSPISDEFRLENMEGRYPVGLSIVSNSGRFRSISTVPYRAPKTARHGYVYFLGDHAPMDNGEVGNPVVIRHRFKAPVDD